MLAQRYSPSAAMAAAIALRSTALSLDIGGERQDRNSKRCGESH